MVTHIINMANKTNPHKAVCSWCGVTTREGIEPISHDCCPNCDAKQMTTVELGARLLELAEESDALAGAPYRLGVARELASHAKEAAVLRHELSCRAWAAEVDLLLGEIALLRGEHTDGSA